MSSASKPNAMQTAIKIRRSLDRLYNFINELEQIAGQVSTLRGRGAYSISSNIKSVFTNVTEMRTELTKDIGVLFGDGYLDVTYGAIIAEERLAAKQKRPAHMIENSKKTIIQL